MEDAIRFSGRILYLSQNPDIIRAQLAGESLSLDKALPLRDNVSTDEITPTTTMLTYDERIGWDVYIGFKARDVLPIGKNQIRDGGFQVTVGGKRYGKGSSRESSPLAELSAGIRLIVAESFERIYQQNCDNLGILTTMDFSVLDRIQAGEAIPITEFLKGRDALTQQVISSGGLLAYSRFKRWPAPVERRSDSSEPLTLVEKIIARKLHPEFAKSGRGEGAFIAADWRFSHDYFTGMAAHLMHRAFGNPVELTRPDQIIAFQDHLILADQSYPHVSQGLLPGVENLAEGHRRFASQYPVKAHGALSDEPGSEGICHAMLTERYALPGEAVVGTDSHTSHSGSLGCLAFGAGATDIANSWATGYIRCKVPETLRVEIEGELRPGITAKDIILHLLQLDDIRNGDAIGLVFEYGGAAVRAMSVDERATLTNMVAELGGFTGIVEPDEKVVEFLRQRRGVEISIEPWMKSDLGAKYRDVIRIDASRIGSMLARPGDPGNGVTAEQLINRVDIDIAYGGSCTAGKRADFDFYHEVLAWGLAKGLKIPEHTRLYLQFGTLEVRSYCEARGYLETFQQAGVELINPGCGSCANCGPGASTRNEQVTISAINRNFPGRSGPGQVWLASPYTVAASALAGHITTFEQLREGCR